MSNAIRGLLIGLILFVAPVFAKPLREFKTPEQQQSFQHLTENLRCVVCQNQNLAESNAPLAGDLRDIIHKKLLAGEAEESITQFMVDRYGQFVLYEPPLQFTTIFLWTMPFLLLVGGAVYLWWVFSRRKEKY